MLIGGMPYPAAAGPIGDLKTAVSGFVIPGTNTSISVSHANLTGITPKAALVMGARVYVPNEPGSSNNCGFTIGAIQAAGRYATFNNFAFGSGSQTNLASTNVQRFQQTGICVMTMDYGTSIYDLGAGSLSSGGAGIAFSSGGGFAWRGSALFFAGDDIDAISSTRDIGTGALVDINNMSLNPDVVIAFSNNAALTAGRSSSHALSFGFATRDGQQRCLLHAEANNVAAGAPFAAILTDACNGQLNPNDGSLTYKVVASAFDAQGFSFQPSASSGTDTLGFIALALGGRRYKIVDFTSPTSTGIFSITAAGFKPGTAVIVGSNLEATDPTFPISTSALMDSFMVSTVTASNAWAHVIRIQSGADPTVTRAWSPQKAIAILNATGTAAISADLDAFTADGMNLNFDVVGGTGKKFFALLIEEGPA